MKSWTALEARYDRPNLDHRDAMQASNLDRGRAAVAKLRDYPRIVAGTAHAALELHRRGGGGHGAQIEKLLTALIDDAHAAHDLADWLVAVTGEATISDPEGRGPLQ